MDWTGRGPFALAAAVPPAASGPNDPRVGLRGDFVDFMRSRTRRRCLACGDRWRRLGEEFFKRGERTEMDHGPEIDGVLDWTLCASFWRTTCRHLTFGIRYCLGSSPSSPARYSYFADLKRLGTWKVGERRVIAGAETSLHS